MKKLCLIYSNCQGDGLRHFLGKTPFAEEYRFETFHNWQGILLEQPFSDMERWAKECDLLIYQPTGELECISGFKIPSTDTMFQSGFFKAERRISFSYIYNHGFFPIMKIGQGPGGIITGRQLHDLAKIHRWGELRTQYENGRLHYDCIGRFANCLAEQYCREKSTDIKLCPFILQEFQSQKLFLSENHPTSAVFAHAAELIYWHLYQKVIVVPVSGENEINLCGAQPVHHSVARELGLRYEPDAVALSHYRVTLDQMIKEYQKA